MKQKIYKVGEKTQLGWEVVKKEVVYSYTMRKKIKITSQSFGDYCGKECYLYYDQSSGLKWVDINGKINRINPSHFEYV